MGANAATELIQVYLSLLCPIIYGLLVVALSFVVSFRVLSHYFFFRKAAVSHTNYRMQTITST